jgi:hypothetical protein
MIARGLENFLLIVAGELSPETLYVSGKPQVPVAIDGEDVDHEGLTLGDKDTDASPDSDGRVAVNITGARSVWKWRSRSLSAIARPRSTGKIRDVKNNVPITRTNVVHIVADNKPIQPDGNISQSDRWEFDVPPIVAKAAEGHSSVQGVAEKNQSRKASCRCEAAGDSLLIYA